MRGGVHIWVTWAPKDVLWYILGKTATYSVVARNGDICYPFTSTDLHLANGPYHEVNQLILLPGSLISYLANQLRF